MPAHPDVEDGLIVLHDNGFRLVTLTNSPPNPDGPSPLENAGLSHLFERSSASMPAGRSNPHPRYTGTRPSNWVVTRRTA